MLCGLFAISCVSGAPRVASLVPWAWRDAGEEVEEVDEGDAVPLVTPLVGDAVGSVLRGRGEAVPFPMLLVGEDVGSVLRGRYGFNVCIAIDPFPFPFPFTGAEYSRARMVKLTASARMW